MGLLSKSFGSVVHNDNARYHDHDSISQVPLMTDETDRNVCSICALFLPRIVRLTQTKTNDLFPKSNVVRQRSSDLYP